MSHADMIYRHLKENKTITSWEAIKEYGNTRLAATICILRQKGIAISTTMKESKNRYGKTVRYAEYRLEGE